MYKDGTGRFPPEPRRMRREMTDGNVISVSDKRGCRMRQPFFTDHIRHCYGENIAGQAAICRAFVYKKTETLFSEASVT